jgi:hypothetical protein
MAAASAAKNMALAHEISVNQNFKLEKLEFETNRYDSTDVFRSEYFCNQNHIYFQASKSK